MDCVCKEWADSRPLWVHHHRDCPQYDVIRDANDLILRLVRGMESWAADEDGVHPGAWPAYADAKLGLGEKVKLTVGD